MRTLVIVYLFVFALMLWGVFTQIIVPLALNRPFFPLFNSKRRQAEAERATANEEKEIAEIHREAKSIRESTTKLSRGKK